MLLFKQILPFIIVVCSCASDCPVGTTLVDAFKLNGTSWSACEDLKVPGGALVLTAAEGGGGDHWFPKGYSMYGSSNDEDPSYYLGLGKENVTRSAMDLLGTAMLSQQELSWRVVADAVPPIKGFGGARTFVGSRATVADTTFDSSGEDASQYGFPPAAAYVFNLTNQAEFGSNYSVLDRSRYVKHAQRV